MTNTVCFTGHRLIDGEYPPDPDVVMALLAPPLLELVNAGAHTFISGGAVGFDLLAFFAVQAAKASRPDLCNELALAIPKQSAKWPRGFYKTMHAAAYGAADVVHKLWQEPAFAGSQSNPYLARDRWMVDHADAIITYWDGRTTGGTYYTRKYALAQGLKVYDLMCTD